MSLFNWGRRRKAEAVSEELMSAADAEPRQFSWAEVAKWAVRLLLWLLARYPALMTTVLQQQRRVAEALPGFDRDAALQAVTVLDRTFSRSPDHVAQALEIR